MKIFLLFIFLQKSGADKAKQSVKLVSISNLSQEKKKEFDNLFQNLNYTEICTSIQFLNYLSKLEKKKELEVNNLLL